MVFGNKEIDFNVRNGRIKMRNVELGLYQLLSYKDASYNNEDKVTFLKLLELTNLHRTADLLP